MDAFIKNLVKKNEILNYKLGMHDFYVLAVEAVEKHEKMYLKKEVVEIFEEVRKKLETSPMIIEEDF